MDTERKRLAYRSSHRGCKETDLILGRFADARLESLAAPLLAVYERFLDEADGDIWDWLTSKRSAPEEYRELLELLKED